MQHIIPRLIYNARSHDDDERLRYLRVLHASPVANATIHAKSQAPEKRVLESMVALLGIHIVSDLLDAVPFMLEYSW
jgi:hypothetical protein